jgi:hypothetical protein
MFCFWNVEAVMKQQLYPVLPRREAAIEGPQRLKPLVLLPLYPSGETTAPPKGKKIFVVSQSETGS